METAYLTFKPTGINTTVQAVAMDNAGAPLTVVNAANVPALVSTVNAVKQAVESDNGSGGGIVSKIADALKKLGKTQGQNENTGGNPQSITVPASAPGITAAPVNIATQTGQNVIQPTGQTNQNPQSITVTAPAVSSTPATNSTANSNNGTMASTVSPFAPFNPATAQAVAVDTTQPVQTDSSFVYAEGSLPNEYKSPMKVNWALVGGIGAGVVGLGVLAIILVKRHQKQQAQVSKVQTEVQGLKGTQLTKTTNMIVNFANAKSGTAHKRAGSQTLGGLTGFALAYVLSSFLGRLKPDNTTIRKVVDGALIPAGYGLNLVSDVALLQGLGLGLGIYGTFRSVDNLLGLSDPAAAEDTSKQTLRKFLPALGCPEDTPGMGNAEVDWTQALRRADQTNQSASSNKLLGLGEVGTNLLGLGQVDDAQVSSSLL